MSPFTLTPARIMILVLGALALVFIIGSITGGLTNYQLLKNSTASSSSQGPASAS
ncbi:MAG: hypothetical protein Q7T08_04570 [Devosia sp.]|nr:hypothetical protein [Devosia sp.]